MDLRGSDMRARSMAMAAAGVAFGILYLFIADSLKTTEAIWLLTRSLGMMSITALFALVYTGELRLLGYKRLSRWHCLLGTATFYLAMLHGFSAAFDRFKWGKGLGFADYIGFSFTDQWLTLLSVGTLAFYVILLVGVTSSGGRIRALGFRRWKWLHYLSYAALAMVFVHSMLLGTDIKDGALGPLLFPLSVFAFSAASGLLVIRVFRRAMPDRRDLALSIMLVLVLSAVISAAATTIKADVTEVDSLSAQRGDMAYAVQSAEFVNGQLVSQANALSDQLAQARNVTSYLSGLIAQKAKEIGDAAAAGSGNVATEQPVVTIPWEEYYGHGEGEDDD